MSVFVNMYLTINIWSLQIIHDDKGYAKENLFGYQNLDAAFLWFYSIPDCLDYAPNNADDLVSMNPSRSLPFSLE